ncbi:hypothetical protein GCM10009689_06330 [Brevibacterium antiquum]
MTDPHGLVLLDYAETTQCDQVAFITDHSPQCPGQARGNDNEARDELCRINIIHNSGIYPSYAISQGPTPTVRAAAARKNVTAWTAAGHLPFSCDGRHGRLGESRANLWSHVPGTVKIRTGGDSPRADCIRAGG